MSVEAKNYDPASGILTVVGQPTQIIGQVNRVGKRKESNQAKLMRELFYEYTFPRGVPLRSIYPHKGESYPQDIIKKSRALTAEINRKVEAKIGVDDLIISNEWRFEINPRYLKDCQKTFLPSPTIGLARNNKLRAFLCSEGGKNHGRERQPNTYIKSN